MVVYILKMSAQFWDNIKSLQEQYRSAGSSRLDQQVTSPSKRHVTEQQHMDEVKSFKKAKRFRVAFNDMQLTYLEKEFKRGSYMHTARRLELSKRLNLSERTIKIWFQNRRMKEKREKTKYDPEERDIEDMGQNDFIVNLRYNEHFNENSLMYDSDKATDNAQDEILSEIKNKNKSEEDSPHSAPRPEEQIERSSCQFMSIADFRDVTKITRPYSDFKKIHINTNDAFHSKYVEIKSRSHSTSSSNISQISPSGQTRSQSKSKTSKMPRRELKFEQGRETNQPTHSMPHSRNVSSNSMSTSTNQSNNGSSSSQPHVHPDLLRYYPTSYNFPGNPYNIMPVLPPGYLNRPTASVPSHNNYQLPTTEVYTTCEGPNTPAPNCHCSCHRFASSVGPGPFAFPPYQLPYMQFMPPMPPGSDYINIKKEKP